MPSPIPAAESDDARYSAILDTLIDQAADLARHIHATATIRSASEAGTPDDKAALDRATIAFDRIARTTRRCIALARHIATRHIATQKPTNTRTHARTTLIRGIEDAIYRKARAGTDTTRLTAEFNETLDDPALEFDLTTRPIAEIIEEIARDMGINTSTRSFIYKPRTPADRTTLKTKATQRSPLPPGEGWVRDPTTEPPQTGAEQKSPLPREEGWVRAPTTPPHPAVKPRS